jgi:group II intron reverse transcriptase/maturase
MNDPKRTLEHLQKLAASEPNKRFDRLHKIVRQESLLTEVWQRIQHNTGSNTPGVDKQVRTDITDQTIHDLAQELGEGYYKPQPVRRTYIPKRNSTKLRPLGIPAIRDRIVQGAVAQILEAIYEPIFRDSSHGFRPKRSTVHALRQMATAYKAGATWIIEGDLVKCFDSIPHGVILNCLRKRIKDERFIDLIRQMLQAGVMEDNTYTATYSGTPQGGLCSPILCNIVLHEFDCWMENHWQANRLQTNQEQQKRANPEYARHKRNLVRWRAQLNGRIPMGRQTEEGLKAKIKQALHERSRIPCYLPRKAIYYCRYADDYTVILCSYSKADAQQLKEEMATWLQQHLGLTQHPEKTHITHWTNKFRFLGYNVQGQRNPNGTRWLRLTIPTDAEHHVIQKAKQLCGYTQIPEIDLFMSVNALMKGWTQYYRYASNATPRFGKLTGIVYWLTAHYLGRKHRCSIKEVMRTHYGVDPKTKKQALYVTQPDGSHLFIWNKYPQWRSILTGNVYAHDIKPIIMTSWASGHSYQQRVNLLHQHDKHCEECGHSSPDLRVHHPNRIAKRPHRKHGPKHIIQSTEEQHTKLLCPDCHLKHHHGQWNDA